jgi:putative transposase
MKFRFVAAERAQFPVSRLCTAVGVTRQGFYAWRRRGPSARSVADQALLARIRQIHQETNCAYGAPRILLDLRHDHLLAVGKKRVARLMRQAGLRRGWQPRRASHHDPRAGATLRAGLGRPPVRAVGAKPALGV